MIKNVEYNNFIRVQSNSTQKVIILNNDYRNTKGMNRPFVVLCHKTYNLIIQEEDNLLAKYIIYMKYMCGISNNNTDFTANQFLSTIGYSTKSNNTKDCISRYNTLLENEKIICIKRNMLEDGKRRNTYSFIDL